MNLETYTINAFRLKSRSIGDDAAVIGDYIYSQDAFFEDVHFKREWLDYYQIGYKAIMVNISDAIAMNATPKYALLTLAMPKTMTKNEVALLVQGVQDACKKYRCEIIGGDTIANSKLDLSVTIISTSKRPLMRKTFKENDLVAYTGTIGSSAKGLKRLFRGGRLSSKSRFVTPVLRQSFVTRTRRLLSAGMDISDGLFSDMNKLTATKNIAVRLEKKIAKSIGCSGEEYEMLITFSKRNVKALKRLASSTRTPLTIVGTIQRVPRRKLCKENHF